MDWKDRVKTFRSEREKKLYNAGFDYAAGALLRQEKSTDALWEESTAPFDRNEFDLGIEDAVRTYRKAAG